MATFTLLLIGFSLKSQTSPDIFIRTFATKDSIILRWIPANSETWKLGNKYGYLIERYTTEEYLDLNGQDPNGKGKLISTSPIFPLAKTDSTWNQLIREDKLNAFVFQSLYENESSTQKDPKKQKLEDQTKFGFVMKACDVSVNTAKAHGLYFVDKSISSGQVYVYRIRIATIPQNTTHFSGMATADEKQSILKAPQSISGDFRNRKSAITFDAASTREEYAGYIIERSEDSIHYVRINTTLLTFAHSQFETNKTDIVYQDSLPQNHKTYWYRARGYSYFGIMGPVSMSIKGKGKEEWNAYPAIDTLYSSDNKSVHLKWHLNEFKDTTYLKGYLVMRGNKSEGPYSFITEKPINKSIFSYTDEHPNFINYYIICSISTLEDSAFSFPYMLELKDNDPPPIPQNVFGMVDTNGIVQLSWNKVDASDLKGYRVFRCNNLKEEFMEVSDSILPSNSFQDTITLQTLTRAIYYSVRSVDRMYNNSKNSVPCSLRRPDKIPPVPALVKSIAHTDSTIQLSWINSSSDDIRCVELRRKSSQGELRQIGNWNGKDTIQHFTDNHALIGLDYTYTLLITDSSGNTSTTVFPVVHFQPRIYPALKAFTATPNFEKRSIVLTWEKPTQPVNRYVIYKSKKGEPIRTWKTVDGNMTLLVDKELYPGNTYIYKVKAILQSGAETTLTSLEVVY